jgi:Tfp pilus assembly protein PilF
MPSIFTLIDRPIAHAIRTAAIVGIVAIAVSQGGCRLLNPSFVSQAARADSRTATQKAAALLNEGNTAEAERQLKRAVKLCPQNAEARLMLAETAWRAGNYAVAMEQLETAAEVATQDDAVQLVRIAGVALEAGQLVAAERAVGKAIDADPASTEAWSMVAALAERRGDAAHSLSAYQRVLDLEPNNATALQNSAAIYRTMGMPRKSLACLHRIREIYPPDEAPRDALVMTGMNLLDLGEPAEATTLLAKASRRPPPSADVLHLLAVAQMAAGHRGASMETIERAIELDPQHGPSQVFRQRYVPTFDRPAASVAERGLPRLPIPLTQ